MELLRHNSLVYLVDHRAKCTRAVQRDPRHRVQIMASRRKKAIVPGNNQSDVDAIYTIVLPECVLGKALSGFMRARQQVAERKELIQNGDETAAESLQLQLKSWTATHTMLADLGGFVVDFRNLSVPTSPDDDEKTVPVRDEPENDRQIREGKVIGQQDISVSEGRRTAGESTTHNIEFTSQSGETESTTISRNE